jgi:hypothetical protein
MGLPGLYVHEHRILPYFNPSLHRAQGTLVAQIHQRKSADQKEEQEIREEGLDKLAMRRGVQEAL